MKRLQSLLTLPLGADDMLVGRKLIIKGETEILETVHNLSVLPVHFHWLSRMIASSWIDYQLLGLRHVQLKEIGIVSWIEAVHSVLVSFQGVVIRQERKYG